MKIICEYIWPLYGKDGHEINRTGKKHKCDSKFHFP
jgi:hypothetical protein